MNTQLDNRFHKLEVAMRQVQGDVDDMKKITKKELNERLLMVETLLGLHRVLPEQISNKQANDAIFRMQCALSSGKELAERESKLKVLDQSVFDGLDEKWRFAAIDGDSLVFTFKSKPSVCGDGYCVSGGGWSFIDEGYDASDWQNSLIERESVELTGSDLCRAMLERGDRCVVCFVAWDSDVAAISEKNIWLVHDLLPRRPNFHAGLQDFYHAVPINPRTGKPLTASEVGL